MKRLKTKEELKEYLSQNSLSDILVANLKQDIKLVEECNNNGASPSCLLVAESKQEYEQILKEYNLRKIPCTKIRDFGIQISYFHIFEISLDYF